MGANNQFQKRLLKACWNIGKWAKNNKKRKTALKKQDKKDERNS